MVFVVPLIQLIYDFVALAGGGVLAGMIKLAFGTGYIKGITAIIQALVQLKCLLRLAYTNKSLQPLLPPCICFPLKPAATLDKYFPDVNTVAAFLLIVAIAFAK